MVRGKRNCAFQSVGFFHQSADLKKIVSVHLLVDKDIDEVQNKMFKLDCLRPPVPQVVTKFVNQGL